MSQAGCMSLRLAMGALNASVVALVTAITLTITLTLSFRALRAIGSTQVSSAAESSCVRIASYLDRPVLLSHVLNNYSRTAVWPKSISANINGTFLRWSDVIMNAYFTNQDIGVVHVIFVEGSRIGFLPSTNYVGLFTKQCQVISPNGTVLMEYAWYNATTLALVPSTHPAYTDDFTPPSDFRPTVLPALAAGTVGGRISLWLEPTVVIQKGGYVGYYSSFVSALHDANGQVLGYGAYSLRIEGINDFLNEIRGTPNTFAFVIDGDGFLFATTYGASFTSLSYNVSSTEILAKGCASTLTVLSEGPPPAVRTVSCRQSMFSYPYAPLNALNLPTAATARDPDVAMITVDGDNYYTVAKQIVFQGVGSSRYLILIMPESDVIGDVVTGRNIAIGVGSGVFVIVAVAAFVIITKLLDPLSVVSARMMRAATLDDDEDEIKFSTFREVCALQEAYIGMNSELRRIRSFVPQSLLISRADDPEGTPRPQEALESAGVNDSPPMTSQVAAISRHSSANTMPGARQTVVEANDEAPPLLQHSPAMEVAGNSGTTTSSLARPPSTRRSSRQRKVTFAPSVMATLQSSIGIRIEHVTVVAADLANFHNTCRFLQPEEIEIRMRNTVDFVYLLTTHHGGVLEHFNGDHFMMTFNGAKRCHDHAIRATTAALAIASQSPADGFNLSWHVGIASGRAFIGNLGADQVKAFNVIGSAVTHASTLQRIAKMYRRRSVLIAHRLFAEIATVHEVRPLDVVCLPGGGKPVVIGEVIARDTSQMPTAAACSSEPRTVSPGLGEDNRTPTDSAIVSPTDRRSSNDDWLYLPAASTSVSSNRASLSRKFFSCLADQRSAAAGRYLELIGLTFSEGNSAATVPSLNDTANAPLVLPGFLEPPPLDRPEGSEEYTPHEEKDRDVSPPLPLDAEDEAGTPGLVAPFSDTVPRVPNHAALLRWEIFEFLRYCDLLPPRTTPPASDSEGDDTSTSGAAHQQRGPANQTSLRDLHRWYRYTPTRLLLQYLTSRMPRVPLMHNVLEELHTGRTSTHMGAFYDWVVASSAQAATAL